MRTRATASPSFRTVRFGAGSSRANEPVAQRVVGAVDDQRRRALEDEEQLLVVALDLVVLGDRLAGRQLDRVDPERGDAERAPHEHPLAVRPARARRRA